MKLSEKFIFRKLETEKSSHQPKGVFYFSDSTTVEVLLSVLNIGKQLPPMLASNFNTSQTRNYHISLLGSFAANFIAVLYRFTISTDA